MSSSDSSNSAASKLDALRPLLLQGPEVTGGALVQMYRNICVRCLGGGWEPHHLIPRSLGGTWQLRNLVCLCGGCHEWAQEDALSKAVLLREKGDLLLDSVGRL